MVKEPRFLHLKRPLNEKEKQNKWIVSITGGFTYKDEIKHKMKKMPPLIHKQKDQDYNPLKSKVIQYIMNELKMELIDAIDIFNGVQKSCIKCNQKNDGQKYWVGNNFVYHLKRPD